MMQFRSLLFRIILFASSPFYALVMVPLLLLGPKGGRAFGKLWTRMVFFQLRVICGITYEIKGTENIPQSGAIVAANHQSMWETFALYSFLPKPAMIMKQELIRIPFFGWFQRPAGNIVVDRMGGAKALRKLLRDTEHAIQDGCQVIVFPQGTRVKPGERGKFHNGVVGIYLGANAPCFPAVHNSGDYWLYPGYHKKPGVITLEFLPPIEAGLDRETFRPLLEDAILISAQSDRQRGKPSSEFETQAAPPTATASPIT